MNTEKFVFYLTLPHVHEADMSNILADVLDTSA